jgi:hypothetical protein
MNDHKNYLSMIRLFFIHFVERMPSNLFSENHRCQYGIISIASENVSASLLGTSFQNVGSLLHSETCWSPQNISFRYLRANSFIPSAHNNHIHILHTPFPIELKTDNRTGWFNGYALHSYSGGAEFESWPGHLLYRLRFLMVFFSPSGQGPDITSGHNRILLNPFQFIYHPLSLATDRLVK